MGPLKRSKERAILMLWFFNPFVVGTNAFHFFPLNIPLSRMGVLFLFEFVDSTDCIHMSQSHSVP